MTHDDATLAAGTTAAIFGCAGTALTKDEAAFFAEARPFGFILFARNVETPEQTRRLVDALRDCVGWRAPVLIDQEGGRVARLKPPHWRAWDPVGLWCAAADDGALSEDALLEALGLRYALIADELTVLDVNVDCAPLLDVRDPVGHDVIGDRALGFTPDAVARRARAVIDGLAAGGVAPVVKHVPGHGRARVDSHAELPVVAAARAELEAVDFAPFRALAQERMAMTAHVVYADIDDARCATMSPRLIEDMVRGWMGFDGLLMTDDLAMKALGPRDAAAFEARARTALAAGCDVILHCNGDPDEMAAVARGTSALAGAPLARAAAAAAIPPSSGFNAAGALARLAALSPRGLSLAPTDAGKDPGGSGHG